MMAFVQYGHHQTEAERAADDHRRYIDQQLKELGEYQAVIALRLGIMVRGGATPQLIEQLEDAQTEYGKRYTAIREYCSAARLAAPAKNRY
jgi:hypothetical protein